MILDIVKHEIFNYNTFDTVSSIIIDLTVLEIVLSRDIADID